MQVEGKVLEAKVELSSVSSSEVLPRFPIYTAPQLMAGNFQQPDFIVPSLIQQGLTILAGKPKVGKSLLAMNVVTALSIGGSVLGVIDVEPIGVLYLALEDTDWKMVPKVRRMFNNYPANNLFSIAFKWSRMDENFFDEMEKFLEQHPETKVVVVDTFTKIRATKRQGLSLYEKEYNESAALKEFADKHGIALVLIHHLRKSEAHDPLDMISGSVGLAGAADTVIIMTKMRNKDGAVLYVTGRDVEEGTFGLSFNSESLAWEITGPAAEGKLTTERQQVLEVLRNSAAPLRLAAIAEAAGKKLPVTHKHLAALIEDGLVKQPAYGVYEAVVESDKGRKSGESGETSVNTMQQQ